MFTKLDPLAYISRWLDRYSGDTGIYFDQRIIYYSPDQDGYFVEFKIQDPGQEVTERMKVFLPATSFFYDFDHHTYAQFQLNQKLDLEISKYNQKNLDFSDMLFVPDETDQEQQ